MIQTKRINRRRFSMSRSCVRFALGALFVAFALESSATAKVLIAGESTYKVINGEVIKEDRSCILIEGEITTKDETQFAIALTNVGTEPHVYLDSPGGEIFPAMRIGHLIRSARAFTSVKPNASCSSACVFLLASGVNRFSRAENSRVGLHRPTFPPEMFAGLNGDDAKRYYDKISEECQKYLREMGMDDKLFADMLRVPSQEIRFVDGDYCDSVSLTGNDPAYQEWARARAIKRLGRDFVERRDVAKKNCVLGGVARDDLAAWAGCIKRYGITTLDPK
jgi:hypothetical protein